MSISILQEQVKQLSNSENRFDVSKAIFLQGCIKLMQDIRMKSFDYSKYKTGAACVIDICKIGDARQKGAVADSFDFQSMLSIPDVKRSKNPEEAIKWIEAQITELAVYYGTTISGDIEYLAYQLFNDFGGLSVLDFVKFFAMCKKREFMTEYEHVKAQGISPDFILKWIAKYEEKRSVVVDGLVRDANGNVERKRNYTPLSVGNIAQNIVSSQEMETLERQANELRKAFTVSLHDKVTLNYEVGETVIPIQSEYMSEKKAGLFLFDFVLNYIAFDIEKAKAIVKGLSENMVNTYNSSSEESLAYFQSEGITLSEYKRQQAIQFVLSGQRKLTGAVPILEKAIEGSDKKAFFSKLGITENSETINVLSFVKSLTRGFESAYYEYLKRCISESNVPLELSQYAIQQALVFMKEYGLERPFGEYDNF